MDADVVKLQASNIQAPEKSMEFDNESTARRQEGFWPRMDTDEHGWKNASRKGLKGRKEGGAEV